MSFHSPLERGDKKEGESIVARSKSGSGALAEAEAEAGAGAAKQGHIEETKIGCL